MEQLEVEKCHMQARDLIVLSDYHGSESPCYCFATVSGSNISGGVVKRRGHSHCLPSKAHCQECPFF